MEDESLVVEVVATGVFVGVLAKVEVSWWCVKPLSRLYKEALGGLVEHTILGDEIIIAQAKQEPLSILSLLSIDRHQRQTLPLLIQ